MTLAQPPQPTTGADADRALPFSVDEIDLRAAADGDVIAAGRVLKQVMPYVSGVVAGVVGARREDATQEALIAVFKGLRSVRDHRALPAWVKVVSIREALRFARREARHPEPSPDAAQAVAVSDGAERAAIADALGRLEPEQRAVLILREVEGLTEAEIADLLGVARGTVKSRLHRARRAFRERWQ